MERLDQTEIERRQGIRVAYADACRKEKLPEDEWCAGAMQAWASGRHLPAPPLPVRGTIIHAEARNRAVSEVLSVSERDGIRLPDVIGDALRSWAGRVHR